MSDQSKGNNMKTVFIFGLGYVGTPLAQALADQGWQVRGTTRTPSKLADKADQSSIS